MLKKSTLSFMLAAVLMLSVLTSCGVKEQPAQSDPPAAQTSSKPEQVGDGIDKTYWVSEEKITIKILSEGSDDYEVSENMPVLKKVQEMTNVNLEYSLLTGDTNAQKEKFALILASNDMPDITVGAGNDREVLMKYAMDGAFLPLQDLIREHAPYMVQALENPLPDDDLPYRMDGWRKITAIDGNVYAVPIISAPDAIGAVFAIRTDWLNDLDLPVPDSAESFYNTLVKFRDEIKNDKPIMPFTSANGAKANGILPIISAFDAHMNLYLDTSDNTIKYGPVEPQYKEGMEFLNKLFNEKLLDNEYVTRLRDGFLEAVSNNQTGFIFGWPVSAIGVANTTLEKINPEYKFEPILPMKSPSGKQYKDTRVSGDYLGIRSLVSSATKYPVEIVKLFNFLYSPKGQELAEWGIEGEHFSLTPEGKKYTDTILNNPSGLDISTVKYKEGLNWRGLPYIIGWDPMIEAIKSTQPYTVQCWEMYMKPGYVEAPLPQVNFTDDELSDRNMLYTEIDTLREQFTDKFIMGLTPMSQFDEFVTTLNNAGLDKMLKLYNDAYKR